MSDKNLKITDLKDVYLQQLAQKHDTVVKNNVLEGKEILAFEKEKESLKIITNITDIQSLKNPQKILSDKNIITVVENYSKKNEEITLFGAILKNDSMTRDERKQSLNKTFEIFYNAIYATTKTDEQKKELQKLKNEFFESVNNELNDSWFEWSISESKINEITKTLLKMHTASSEELAGEIFNYIDETAFSFGDREFDYLMDSLTEGNVISVAQKIKQHPQNSEHESLLKILAQEYTVPFDITESADKNHRIKTFVVKYFKAANYSDTPYMKEAQKLTQSIVSSSDTGSNILTSDIEQLDGLMDALITNKPLDIAKKLFNVYNNNSYALDRADTRVLLDKINASNVYEILNEFSTLGDGKSLLQLIDEEWVGDKKPKSYINKIILAQIDASGKSQDKTIMKHITSALNNPNESIADLEELTKIITTKEQSPKLFAETLFKYLSDDEDNVNKEVVKYILNSLDKGNIVDTLTEFEKLSKKTPLTEYLQENGEEEANKHIKSIINKLIDVNLEKFKDEQFNITFKIKPEDIKSYVSTNIDNEKNISRLVKSFLPASEYDIAKNIEEIADDKTGAANDITFKLWISKIDAKNVKDVIETYQKKYAGNTPLNAIIEERNSDKATRQALALHLLSSVIQPIGEENLDEGQIAEFTDKLEDELYGWGMADAAKLNTILLKISEKAPAEKVNDIQFDPNNLKLTNIRVDVPTLELGEKYGQYSWQYENLKGIKTLEDVAQFTGLRVDFLKEMIRFEGYETSAYTCSSGKRTIGIGHNFHSAKASEKKYLENTKLSNAQINQIFAYDLTRSIHDLVKNKGIDTYQLTPGEYEALVDLSFNAPGYMKTLTQKTLKAIEIRKNDDKLNAAKLFEEASLEFNQQFSNGKIMPGLCKRRIQNVLRYMDVKNFAELSNYPNAKKRVIILALNGYNNSSFFHQEKYVNDICEILNISPDEFSNLNLKTY